VVLVFGAADLIAGIANFLTGGSSLPQIGTNLSQFMTNAIPFFAGIMLVDESVLNAAKNLAGMIVLFTAADVLQGLTSWLTGGSSLADFGEELAQFGPAIAKFADKVKDVKPEAVEGAAAAGKIMADMATNLPNSGGVLGWFMGENDMNKFGAQLVPFGKALKEYSEEVAGLDADAVENSAIAGKAIAELATNLPNSGGVLGWFMGENDMDKFGAQLVPFGKAMKNYADEVADIKPETVTASADAAKALSELANGLPNSGGLVSWFTGDNEIGKFGKGLKKFGSYFSDFYDTISDIKVPQLDGVMGGLQQLTEFANGLSNIDSSSMSEFIKNLSDMGTEGIDAFINALTGA
ncbi:MAG: hypothetical protein K2H85_00950, partial [Allobaculum sp.]|nr:hypothetical protein [Allobaculum sp.]